jgi:hypothetical protein
MNHPQAKINESNIQNAKRGPCHPRHLLRNRVLNSFDFRLMHNDNPKNNHKWMQNSNLRMALVWKSKVKILRTFQPACRTHQQYRGFFLMGWWLQHTDSLNHERQYLIAFRPTKNSTFHQHDSTKMTAPAWNSRDLKLHLPLNSGSLCSPFATFTRWNSTAMLFNLPSCPTQDKPLEMAKWKENLRNRRKPQFTSHQIF